MKTPDKKLMSELAFKFVPPLIRESLLDERDFKEKYDFTTDGVVSFGNSIVSFKRSKLFDSIRSVFDSDELIELSDTKDQIWNLSVKEYEANLASLVLSSDQQQLEISDLLGLSGDVAIRIRFLEESASDLNLPHKDTEVWRHILAARTLEDDEVENLQRDMRDTPVHMKSIIREEITKGESSSSSLVPNSRRYFERLVGVYDGSSSILDYAAVTGRIFFKQLSEWQPYEGFLYSLFLSSHSSLTAEIKVDHLEKEDLESAFDYLEKHGDILSQLGAFEVGLRILPDRPEVEPYLIRLVQQIRDDDLESKVSRFKLFTALFVLVDGELARTKLLAKEPPFYRRLASIAQSMLIYSEFIQCGADYGHFSDWVFNNRGRHFYMQSLVDMRTEPRWNPDLVDSAQLQAECFGRIFNISHKYQSNIVSDELRDIVLGSGEKSLIKRCGALQPYFSGPLEGIEESASSLSGDLIAMIEEKLNNKKITADSFTAFVNAAMVFKVEPSHAELAMQAIKLCNYHLINLEDKVHLMSVLNGLAKVAAISRNSDLADELRIFVRHYRHDSEYGLSANEAMRLCLIASAAYEDLIDWREFVGEWLTELAFGELVEDEGVVLYSHLSILLSLVPELWVSCARADAALQAWCSR